MFCARRPKYVSYISLKSRKGGLKKHMVRTYSRRDTLQLIKKLGFVGAFMAFDSAPLKHFGRLGFAQTLERANVIGDYTWDTALPTTLQKTINSVTYQGIIYAQGELPIIRRDLAPNFLGLQGKEIFSLGCFIHITDTHSTDEESPEIIHYRRFAGYSPHILDAHIATIRRINSLINLDFILHTGDATESAQENELEWFLGIMDGGLINPNSGAEIEPNVRFDGPENQPFFAQGIGNIPWYFTMGNHDELVMGTFPAINALNKLAVGGFAPIGYSTDLPFQTPFFGNSLPIEIPGVRITPDPKRRLLDRNEFIEKLLASNSQPKGHGYSSTNIAENVRLYKTDPIEGIPIRLISLDTASPIGLAQGSLREEQYMLLQESLEQALNDDMLVIIASHHPADNITDRPPLEGFRSKNGRELTTLLNNYPNVVAHIAGHTHSNIISPKKTYYEVQTCAAIDPPQQTRIFEILWDGSDYITIATIMLDFEEGNTIADEGRILAFNDQLVGGDKGRYLDRNTILAFPIPKEIQEKLQSSNLKPPRLLR